MVPRWSPVWARLHALSVQATWQCPWPGDRHLLKSGVSVLCLALLVIGPTDRRGCVLSTRMHDHESKLSRMRSYRELWLWLGGVFLVLVPFPAAIAIAYYAKQTSYSVLLNRWMLASCAFFLAAFVCFLGAIRVWSFPPRKKLTFPNVQVHVYGNGVTNTDHTVYVHGASSALITPATLYIFKVRIVNLEAEQNANLTVRIYVKLVPGSFDVIGETIWLPPDWSLSPTLNLTPLQMPIVLQPGTAISGDLVYEMTSHYQYASPFSARLELEDHVSGKRVSIPAQMGKFDKRTMVASSGGAQILEEGQRIQTDQQGGADQTSPEPPAATDRG